MSRAAFHIARRGSTRLAGRAAWPQVTSLATLAGGSRLPAARVARMLRSVFAIALLFAPASAAAEDCMCLNGDNGFWSQRVLESFEVGPFFSSDGTLLSSRVVVPVKRM